VAKLPPALLIVSGLVGGLSVAEPSGQAFDARPHDVGAASENAWKVG
jgi:hypothetical protein